MQKNNLSRISHCEVCGNVNLVEVLNLGQHPLCDDLVPVSEDRICKEYPIEVLFCEKCKTAHQRFQVPKADLFPKTYHYRARFTIDVLNGMKELVEDCESYYGKFNGKKVLDIGCNDGSLLDFFSVKGAETFGIEPTDAFLEAAEKGHKGFNDFLTRESAERFVEIYGKPDLITFTNVFAHIEKLEDVLTALKILMKHDTLLIIENHYLRAVFDKNQFDTFYHEHPRTYSATSFSYISERMNLALLNVEFPKRYGGNIRVMIGDKTTFVPRNYNLKIEQDFIELFESMQQNISEWKESTKTLIEKYVKKYGKIEGKALPGRAAIIIKLLGLNEEHISAIFEKPGSKKIGHYVPGTRIPIKSDDELLPRLGEVEVLINFAWHIHEEIDKYLRKVGFKGDLIKIL